MSHFKELWFNFDEVLSNIEGFFTSLVGYWKVQKGKGTLRPTTRLNFLVDVYEKAKELLSLTLRIEEAFPNEVEVISDLNELVATVANSAK